MCLQESNACMTTLVCDHTFHRNCITTWATNNQMCPLCRATISCKDPKSVTGLIFTALLLAKRAQFHEAFTCLNEANEVSQYDLEVQIAGVDVEHEVVKFFSIRPKDNKRALEILNFVLQVRPRNVILKVIRASIFRDASCWVESLADLDSGLRLEPNNTFALSVRWNVHARLGNNASAIIDLQKLLELQPDNQKVVQELEKMQE